MGIHKVSRAISAGEVHVQLRPRAQISNPDNGLSRKGRTSGEVENRAEIRAEDAGNRRTKELTKNWRSSEENSHRHEDGEDSMTQDEGDEESPGAAPSAEDDDGEAQEPAERIKHCDLIVSRCSFYPTLSPSPLLNYLPLFSIRKPINPFVLLAYISCEC